MGAKFHTFHPPSINWVRNNRQ